MDFLFDMCKICINDIKIFELIHMDQQILTQITDISGVKFNEDETNRICQKCLSYLEAAYAFRNQCIEAKKHIMTPPLDKSKRNVKTEDISDITPLHLRQDVISNIIENPVPKTKQIQKLSETIKTVPKKAHTLPLICDICGNIFERKQHFLLHVRRHTSEKPFECEICKKKFYTNSELSRHMRSHTGEKPFECKYCHRKFSDCSTQKKHERTHTNERPFICTQCGKAFTCSYILKNHILTHTGERAFRCVLCNKSFQRDQHLRTHYKSLMHHENVQKSS